MASRQLAWQHKKKALGLCVQCGLPSDHRPMCNNCRRKHNSAVARWRLRNGK